MVQYLYTMQFPEAPAHHSKNLFDFVENWRGKKKKPWPSLGGFFPSVFNKIKRILIWVESWGPIGV